VSFKPGYLRVITSWLLIAVSLSTFWWLLQFLLTPGRGLDLTDEGLYLLAADPRNRESSWGFPWGWHTAPFNYLVQYNVAHFRTVGALFLALMAAWLGWSVARYSMDIRDESKDQNTSILIPIVAGVTGSCASLLYYAGYLRTPGYNWVNLIGITIYSVGLIRFLHTSLYRLKSKWSAQQHIATVISASGMFFTVPAKPSTLPAALMLGWLLVAVMLNVRTAIKWISFNVLIVAIIVVSAVSSNFWPRNAYQIFQSSSDVTSLTSDRFLTSALNDLLSLPQDVFQQVISQSAYFIPILVLLSVALVPRNLRGMTFIAWSAFSWLSLQVLRETRIQLFWNDRDNEGINRWIYQPFVSAGLAFSLGLIPMYLCVKKLRLSVVSSDAVTKLVKDRKLIVPMVIAILPFVFGFGSGHGIFAQASLAASFFVVTAIVLFIYLNWSLLPLLLCVIVVVLSTLSDSYQVPYRISSLDQNNIPIELGPSDSRILVDDEYALFVNHFRERSSEAGWSSGTPLVGVAWRWSSTVPYLLEADVPSSLMLTLFGYQGSIDVVTKTLSRSQEMKFDFASAWLLVTSDVHADTQIGEELRTVLALVTEKSGKSFPESFSCVVIAGEIELWRPSEPEKTGYMNNCPFTKFTYNLSSGAWR
jgi:hypothetical protein